MVEYPFTKMVFQQQSAFQLVQITESVDHGRMLLLDGLVNLAESDTQAYTHMLMGLPEVGCMHDV